MDEDLRNVFFEEIMGHIKKIGECSIQLEQMKMMLDFHTIIEKIYRKGFDDAISLDIENLKN